MRTFPIALALAVMLTVVTIFPSFADSAPACRVMADGEWTTVSPEDIPQNAQMVHCSL